jgi:hypothetical protein
VDFLFGPVDFRGRTSVAMPRGGANCASFRRKSVASSRGHVASEGTRSSSIGGRSGSIGGGSVPDGPRSGTEWTPAGRGWIPVGLRLDPCRSLMDLGRAPHGSRSAPDASRQVPPGSLPAPDGSRSASIWIPWRPRWIRAGSRMVPCSPLMDPGPVERGSFLAPVGSRAGSRERGPMRRERARCRGTPGASVQTCRIRSPTPAPIVRPRSAVPSRLRLHRRDDLPRSSPPSSRALRSSPARRCRSPRFPARNGCPSRSILTDRPTGLIAGCPRRGSRRSWSVATSVRWLSVMPPSWRTSAWDRGVGLTQLALWRSTCCVTGTAGVRDESWSAVPRGSTSSISCLHGWPRCSHGRSRRRLRCRWICRAGSGDRRPHRPR